MSYCECLDPQTWVMSFINYTYVQKVLKSTRSLKKLIHDDNGGAYGCLYMVNLRRVDETLGSATQK